MHASAAVPAVKAYGSKGSKYGRSGEYTEIVFKKGACVVGESLRETIHELGVGEHVVLTAGDIMEEFVEVNLGLTLFDKRECHGIVLF